MVKLMFTNFDNLKFCMHILAMTNKFIKFPLDKSWNLNLNMKLLNLLKLQPGEQMVKLFQFYFYVGMGKQ